MIINVNVYIFIWCSCTDREVKVNKVCKLMMRTSYKFGFEQNWVSEIHLKYLQMSQYYEINGLKMTFLKI